jgi:RES domain-containing protein
MPAPAPARWHRAGEPWPLYATLDEATAWAEWRAASGGAIDPADDERRLWSLRIEELPVVDLRSGATREALGVAVDDLTGDWQVPQELARRLASLGAEGAVVPSAAHPGHWNLVVFPAGFGRLRVGRGRTMHPAPPVTAISAEAPGGARPPTGSRRRSG